LSSTEDSKGRKSTITTSTEGKGARLSVKLSVASKPAEQPLKDKYGVARYDLTGGYSLPETLAALVPSGIPDYEDEGQAYLERLMRAMYYFKQAALVGPSGTGKTHVVYLAAQIAGLPLMEVSCGLQTSVQDLFGRFTGPGRENWVDGAILSWCRYGGILYLDDANLMRPELAVRLSPLLDTRGRIILTEKDNEVVPRSQFAYLVISMNPSTSELMGSKPLNPAFRRRMSVWIDFDYLSVGTKVSPGEVKMLSEQTKIPQDTAEKVVRVAAEMRKRYKTGDLPYAPSLGDLNNWATLIADGMSPKEAAEETVVSLTSDDAEIQAIVRRIIGLVFGAAGGAGAPGGSGSSSNNNNEPVEKSEHP
jgi:nitric oxide reductase NorQ protein